MDLSERQLVIVSLAIMADRKSRSVTFAAMLNISVGAMKRAIEHITSQEITLYQSLGNEEFLVELTSRNAAELLIEEGFDVNEFHVSCHPPHGYFANVSIMGLRSYVEDAEVLEALAPYGEIKSDVLRLKYRKDHEFAGIENGNRLVKMVLATRSIPYSMKIGVQWCRIIHNNQQPICSECHQEGHVRRKCPEIECRLCKTKGHMSFDCTQKDVNSDAQTDPTPIPKEPTAENELNNDGDDEMQENIQGNPQEVLQEKVQDSLRDNMDYDDTVTGQKRPHSTDSEDNVKGPQRRQRCKPVPNLLAARKREKPSTNDQPASKLYCCIFLLLSDDGYYVFLCPSIFNYGNSCQLKRARTALSR